MGMGALNHLAEIFFSLLYKIFNNAANKTVPKRSIMQEKAAVEWYSQYTASIICKKLAPVKTGAATKTNCL